MVAFTFSAEGPHAAYLRPKMLANRTAGAIMGLLGVKLVVEATRAAQTA